MPKLRVVEYFTNSKQPSKVVPQLNTYTLMFDGGSRGNPGPSGAGYVLYDDEKEIAYGYHYIGVATNNIAEYTGLILGLRAAISRGIERLVVKGDSQLILNQVQCVWSVSAHGLLPLCKEAKQLLSQFPDSSIQHVRREHNKRADALANQAMNTKSSKEIYM